MGVVAASALKVTLSPRPFADPDAAARKLMKLANAFEPVQDGRILALHLEETRRGLRVGFEEWENGLAVAFVIW
jgi:hypothetical protein